MQERTRENQSSTDAAKSSLNLCLLGAFALHVHGREVLKLPRPTQWLLALLVLKRSGPLSREWLAETLWPETPQERSAFYLRRSLTELRAALGTESERLTSPTRATLRFDFTDTFCDVIAFDNLIDAEDEASLEVAVTLYRGPLLQECSAGWVVPEQVYRSERYLTTLETLAERRELSDARALLRKAVQTDPLRETAQRALMRVMGAAGDSSGVERQYRKLKSALQEELNAEPTQETVELYQALKTQARSLQTAPFHNLPRALTSLIGREEERDQVRAALRSNRLVTLIGPGGVGKTRLALFVAEAETGNQPAGICFVDMTAATKLDALQTLAAALKLPANGNTPLLEAIRRFLQLRRMLLILDNAEHIADACALLADDLLRACPGITLLCTSRQPLYIAGEVVIPVAPLATGDGSPKAKTISDLIQYDSVRLLLDRVSSAAPAFRLECSDAPAVAAICRSLDGLPLALELVAIRFRSLAPREIAARLDMRFCLLSGGSPAQPRHRTLHATLDWSYELLSEPEQTLLRHLSMFRGGWTLVTAEAICLQESQDISVLMTALVDKSLVVYEIRNGQHRYRLLEMTRQYADERLNHEERSSLQARHAEYFYDLAQSVDAAASVRYFPDTTEVPGMERDNFRAAQLWYQSRDDEKALWLEFSLYIAKLWAPENVSLWIERLQREPLPPTLLGLRATCSVGEWALWGQHPACESILLCLLESARLCDEPDFQIRALDLLSCLEHDRGDAHKTWEYMEQATRITPRFMNSYSVSRTYSKAALCLGRTGHVELALERLEAQIHLERQREEWHSLCFTLYHAGELLFEQEEYVRAWPYWQEAIPLAERCNTALLPYLWRRQGQAAMRQKNYAHANECLSHGLAVSRQYGPPDRQGWALWELAELAFLENRRDEAESYLRECLLHFQSLHEPHSIVRCLIRLAQFSDYARAAILVGSVEKANQDYRFRENSAERSAMEQIAASIQSKESYTENRQRGRQMTLTQAVEFATGSY